MAMDVRGILEQQRDQLLDVDLEVLEEELGTGSYDKAYIQDCQEKIASIRAERASAAASAVAKKEAVASTTPDSSDGPLSPFNSAESNGAVSRRDAFGKALLAIRAAGGSKTTFRKLFATCAYADEKFIDENIDLFTPDELTTLLKTKAFSESFLEKYFSSLDHETLARTQEFSEEFFIAHYGDLDPETVLKKGVNGWRDKASRSTKLDVFLRIKGVRF